MSMQTRSYWSRNNLTFRDETFGPSKGGSLWQTCPIAALTDPSVAHVFYDDFHFQNSTKASADNVWTFVEDDGAGGTDAVQDAAGGIYKHFCDGDANDEAYMISASETWKFAAGKSLWLEARIAITEGNTDDAGWVMGLMDNAGADSVVDTGSGPAASYDGALIYGVKDALTISFETSNAATQSTSTSCGSYASGTFFNAGFWARTESNSDTVAVVTPYINGTSYTARNVTLAGLEEMHFILGVKGAGAEEAFSIDYVKIVQIR